MTETARLQGQPRKKTMTSTQSYVTDLMLSQMGVNSADMRSDLEHAIELMNNYPPEQRTLTLMVSLMRNSDARSALSSLLGMEASCPINTTIKAT